MQGCRVAAPQSRQRATGREFPSIEKVRADPTGLELKFTELQYLALECQFDEILLETLRGRVHTSLHGVLLFKPRSTAPNSRRAAVWLLNFTVSYEIKSGRTSNEGHQPCH